jgi:DNA-binding CsgD family transcriptional regulator
MVLFISGTRMQTSNLDRFVADAGMVLLNQALKMIAMDRGAAAILSYRNDSGDAMSALPKEILTILQNRESTDLGLVKACFRTPNSEYSCLVCSVEPANGSFAEPLIALHFEEVSSTRDAIRDVAVEFQLTDREIEVLQGISMGLTSREIGDWLKISPNTVKAFLRLIMLKMGVKTRGGVVANILNRSMTGERAAPSPSARRVSNRTLKSSGT